MPTQFLNNDLLQSIDSKNFSIQLPFPNINPTGMIIEKRFAELSQSMPDLTLFKPTFGRARKYGQTPHDRYTLKYQAGLPLSAPWQTFLAELNGKEYKSFLQRMFKKTFFSLDFFWFFTPSGCSVSPHCDHKDKIGAHLFYMNTQDDWDPAWGGDTLLLDDGGKLPRGSAPEFTDFQQTISSKSLGNYSLLFARTPNSWHGVKKISCPDGYYRKLFMVAIKKSSPFTSLFAKWRTPTAEY